MSVTVGVDLGGTHMQIGVVDDSCAIIGRAGTKTEAARGASAIFDTIAEQVRLALDRAGVSRADAVGLAAPGAVDPERGLVLNAPNLTWDDVPAASELQRRLDMPVVLDNDVNAAVFAEQRMGAGVGCQDLVGLWIGTGIGGGLVLGGEVYQGPRRTAGEIGHIIVDPDNAEGLCELEHQCSRTAIARQIGQAIARGEPSSLAEIVRSGHSCSAAQIAQALNQGDALALRTVNRAGETIGRVLGSIVTLLSLERIVVGGGLVEEAGRFIIEPIERTTRATCWPEELRGVEVRATALGSNAGLLGAALLASGRVGLRAASGA